MIKHIVIWQLNDQTTDSKTSNALAIKEKLESLNGLIDGLISIEVGIDISREGMSGDLVLYSVFASRQALESYKQHPAHVEAAQFITSVTQARQVVDYELA